MIKIKYTLLIVGILLLTACGKKADQTVKIAQQYGLAYAPIQIMKEKGFLEEELPDKTIEWVKLANTAAIREAVLADNLDVGFMGIPPFLIALDKGMEWKMMTGLSESPLGLITNDNSIKTLSDFIKTDKIALPQPGSIQHILLAMACERVLGKADALDQQLVSMKHPDGFQALMAKQDVKAHFTSPPYLLMALAEEQNHMVISGEEAMGSPFTFIVGACTQDFYDNNQEAYQGLQKAIKRSMDYMVEHQEESLELLMTHYDLDKETLKSYLEYEGMVYSSEIKGVEKFIDFMVRHGYLDKTYELEDVIWE
ncbi:ABC transporter substrate-binding protein [Vallitalea pronyensis]|uniref:ABC transporter substrate-binding protein n=1 Tax=Vallitalea pronyensis TaxID=1348613 RepID=A0A8J8SJ63_9FIRM|nr:ABC transporter substrate-binding protein [Vallitalea pronyensis]QUI25167.1 ABC transporter substrate-binding protein [Vallitalea pronyensis]